MAMIRKIRILSTIANRTVTRFTFLIIASIDFIRIQNLPQSDFNVYAKLPEYP